MVSSNQLQGSRRYPTTRWRMLVAWAPLVLLPLAVIVFTPEGVPRWAYMWMIAPAIYVGFKWLSWNSSPRPVSTCWQQSGWWLLWPGMDVRRFLAPADAAPPTSWEWQLAAAKTALGLALAVVGAQLIAGGQHTLGGWIGMWGLVFILHFGTFHLISCAWRAIGVHAQPIMNRPFAAQSVGEFWGRRWNLAFRDAGYAALFQPVARRFGTTAATCAVFALSAAVHEAAISIPAGAAYGLPTIYFTLQAASVLVENSLLGKRLGLGRGRVGWFVTMLIVFGAIPLLFPLPFVHRVAVPFFQALTPAAY